MAHTYSFIAQNGGQLAACTRWYPVLDEVVVQEQGFTQIPIPYACGLSPF